MGESSGAGEEEGWEFESVCGLPGMNTRTPLRRFWLPSLTEILEKVGPSSCLSKLDLTAGFHQIEVEEDSMPLTSFVCPMGKFMYCRMPFGLKNAPAIF